MKTKEKSGGRVWWVFAGCVLLQGGATGVFVNCISLFYAPISAELGVGNGAMALFTTTRAITMALAMTGITMLYKKVDLRLLLTVLALVGGGCFAAQALFHHIWQWYVMGAIFGVTLGGLVTVPVTIIINNWFYERVGLLLGLALASSGIVGALVSPLCSALIGSLGWRTAAVLIAVLALAMMLPATTLLLRLTPAEVGCLPYGAKAADSARPAAALEQKNAPLAAAGGVFAICFFIVLVPNGVVQLSYQVALFAKQEGLGLSVAAAVNSLVMVGNMLGKLVLGALNDRRGTWFTTGFASVALGLACLCFSAGSSAPLLLYLGAPLFGFSFSLSAMLPSLLCRRVYAGQYRSRYSVLMTGSTLVGAAQSVAIGSMSDWLGSYRPLYFWHAVACLACCVLAVLLAAKERRCEAAAKTA